MAKKTEIRPFGGGWVRLFRDELDGPVFAHPELWRLWCWCLTRAGHKERTLTVKTGRGDSIVTLGPGAFLFGRNVAAKELNTPHEPWPTAWPNLKDSEKSPCNPPPITPL